MCFNVSWHLTLSSLTKHLRTVVKPHRVKGMLPCAEPVCQYVQYLDEWIWHPCRCLGSRDDTNLPSFHYSYRAQLSQGTFCLYSGSKAYESKSSDGIVATAYHNDHDHKYRALTRPNTEPKVLPFRDFLEFRDERPNHGVQSTPVEEKSTTSIHLF